MYDAVPVDPLERPLEWVRTRLQEVAEELRRIAADPRATNVQPSQMNPVDFRPDAPLARVDRLGLDEGARRVLWLLVAHEVCPVARRMVRDLATETVMDPTTDVIRRVAFGGARTPEARRVVAADGPLRRYGLIERTDTNPNAPEHRQTWRVSSRVMALVDGVVDVDLGTSALASALPSPARSIGMLELRAGAAGELREAIERSDFAIIHGRPGSGRRSLARAAASEHGRACLEIDARGIARDVELARSQVRAIEREARLLHLVPLLTHLEALDASEDTASRLDVIDTELTGLVLATASRPIARRWVRAPVLVELTEITSVQRERLWKAALPELGDADVTTLTSLYPLAPAYLDAVARASLAHAGTRALAAQDLEAGLRTVLDDRFAGLARRLQVSQGWDDVVLKPEQEGTIHELVARIRERRTVYEDWGFGEKVGRGVGIAALFSGPPGTGKTMVAGLIARALRIEIYQVDLSKVVSKWIGETEKNLAAVFDAAEAGHVVLLFDEADALFGKRTDVKSSNDRHANQEVNYLLQRLESFKGICILTTNHEAAIDDAFRRRLALHVRFAMPDLEERRRLWETMIPSRAPRAVALDLEDLAKQYVMSGGYIRNAVLRAAFFAADEGGLIDVARLARAAELEYEAMGKVTRSSHH